MQSEPRRRREHLLEKQKKALGDTGKMSKPEDEQDLDTEVKFIVITQSIEDQLEKIKQQQKFIIINEIPNGTTIEKSTQVTLYANDIAVIRNCRTSLPR